MSNFIRSLFLLSLILPISLENCLIRLFSMTISYARYDKNMATGKPNKCNRICWNTLFLSADFDAHTQGTTNKVTFIIQRGDVSDVDGITNERVFYNHTILAAVNLDLTTSENTFKTSTNTPEGVMCSFFLSFYANKNKLSNFSIICVICVQFINFKYFSAPFKIHKMTSKFLGPLMPHRWETLKLTHKINDVDQEEQFTYA